MYVKEYIYVCVRWLCKPIHVLKVSMHMNMYTYMCKPVCMHACMHARVHACMFPWWLSRGNHARAMRKQLKLSWAIFFPSQVVLVETLGYSCPVLGTEKNSEHETWDVPNRAPPFFFPTWKASTKDRTHHPQRESHGQLLGVSNENLSRRCKCIGVSAFSPSWVHPGCQLKSEAWHLPKGLRKKNIYIYMHLFGLPLCQYGPAFCYFEEVTCRIPLRWFRTWSMPAGIILKKLLTMVIYGDTVDGSEILHQLRLVL